MPSLRYKVRRLYIFDKVSKVSITIQNIALYNIITQNKIGIFKDDWLCN
jgi:hypothetical protein